MIQSASTPELQTEFLRCLSGKPYFESTLGTHLHLFGNHPASGWAFYLLPGSAVLELRGGSAVLCGALPGGEAGEDAREELTGFLRFLHADTLRTEHPLTLPGWQPAAPLTLWELPKGRALPLPPAPPAELVPDKAPSMLPVSRLVFAESDAEADEFYSAACTALDISSRCAFSSRPGAFAGSLSFSTRLALGTIIASTMPGWRSHRFASAVTLRAKRLSSTPRSCLNR